MDKTKLIYKNPAKYPRLAERYGRLTEHSKKVFMERIEEAGLTAHTFYQLKNLKENSSRDALRSTKVIIANAFGVKPEEIFEK